MLPRFEPDAGDTIREYMGHYNLTEDCLAKLLDMTADELTRLLTCQMPITPDIARRLERIFMRPASFWLNLSKKNV